jgi:UDP-N-acetylmuramate: L-alanyl-gamma-D-glutamyl-meso-diaminopimelate ligase
VTECLSAEAVAKALRDRGRDAAAFPEIDDIVRWVVEGRQEGDTVLVMSNGAFGGIWEKLLAALEAAQDAAKA